MAKLLRTGYSYHQSEHLIGSSPGGSGGFPLNARQVVSTGSRLNPTVYGYTFLLATLNLVDVSALDMRRHASGMK